MVVGIWEVFKAPFPDSFIRRLAIDMGKDICMIIHSFIYAFIQELLMESYSGLGAWDKVVY